MTNEERDIINQFIARVGGGHAGAAGLRRLGAGDHDASRCRRSTPRRTG